MGIKQNETFSLPVFVKRIHSHCRQNNQLNQTNQPTKDVVLCFLDHRIIHNKFLLNEETVALGIYTVAATVSAVLTRKH